MCAVGEREASKRKENKWIGIFVKHLVNGTQRITITITITITIVRVLGRVVVVGGFGWLVFGSVRFLFSFYYIVFVFVAFYGMSQVVSLAACVLDQRLV